MSTKQPPRLGTCPQCGTMLASLDVSIRVANDQPAVYTDCPICRDTVNPD